MFYNHYEMIAKQRQQEMEQSAKEAWKFSVSKNESMIQKVMKRFQASDKLTKTNSNFDTCAAC